MEVVVPVQDFHLDSTTSSPYVSAPSSPKSFSGNPFNYYCHYSSAPTSPTRAAAILAQSSAIPFNWEEKPGTPKSKSMPADDHPDNDFAFDFSGQLEKGGPPPVLTTADELFEKGKIRPLKPPPRLSYPVFDDRSSIASSSPRSPKSPGKGLWSPRHREKGDGGGGSKGFDPFAAAMVEATRERGRERTSPSPSIPSDRSRKGSRSLSPMRGGGGGGGFFHKNPPPPASTTNASSTTSYSKNGGGSKKWRLRDLLLFRSASEGRATGNSSKDPLRKYTPLPSSGSLASSFSNNKKVRGGEDSKNSSFRSTDSNGSMRRGSGQLASAHEIHYTSNRAASEELKKKTPLPYRQSLFGCLRFNPAVNGIARRLNSHSFNRGRT